MKVRTLTVLFAAIAGFAGAADTETITREDLPSRITAGQKAKLILMDGVRLEGVVTDLAQGRLQIDVRKSDDRRRVALGGYVVALNAFASITTCRFTGKKRAKLPLILASTLGLTSFVLASATEELKGTYMPRASGFTTGLIVGGHYLGKAWDQKCTTLVLKDGG